VTGRLSSLRDSLQAYWLHSGEEVMTTFYMEGTYGKDETIKQGKTKESASA
jgi:hypothetical protein